MTSSDRSAWKTQAPEKESVNRRQIARKVAWLLLFILICALWLYLVLSPFGLPRTHIIALGNGIYPIDSVESIPFVEFEKNSLSKIEETLYHNQDASYSSTSLLSPETIKGVTSKDSVIIFLYFRCAAINGKAYFITSEFDLNKPDKGLLSVEWLLNEISNLPAKNKLIIIPAGSIHYDPRLGIFTDHFPKLLRRSMEEIAQKSDNNPEKTITVYFPHENFEASRTSILLSSSLTTHFFCEGIKGAADFNQDKKIDVQEIGSYISRSVYDWIHQSNSDEPNLWSPQNATLISSIRKENRAERKEKNKWADNGFLEPKIQNSYPLPIHLIGNKKPSKEKELSSRINSPYENILGLINSKKNKENEEDSSSPSTTGDNAATEDQSLKERERLAADWVNLESFWQQADNLGRDRTKKFPNPNYLESNFHSRKVLKKAITRKQQKIIEDLQASTLGFNADSGGQYSPSRDKLDLEQIVDRSQLQTGGSNATTLWSSNYSNLHSLSLEEILRADQDGIENPIAELEKLLAEETPDKLRDWLKNNRSLNQFAEVNWANHLLNLLDIEWKDVRILIKTRILSEKVSALDAALPNIFRSQIIDLDRLRLQSEAVIHQFRLDACTLERFIRDSVNLQQQYQLLCDDFETILSAHSVWLTEFESAEEILRLYCNPYSIEQPDVSYDLVSDWIKQLQDLKNTLNRLSSVDNPKRLNIHNLTEKLIKTGGSIRSKLFKATVNSNQNGDESIHKLPFDRQLLNCTSIPSEWQKEYYLDVIDEEYYSALAYSENDVASQNKHILFTSSVDRYLKRDRLLRQIQRAVLYLRYLGIFPQSDQSLENQASSNSINRPVPKITKREAALLQKLRDLEQTENITDDFEWNESEKLLLDAGGDVSNLLFTLSANGPPRSDDKAIEFQTAKARSLLTDWRDAYVWMRDPEYTPIVLCQDALVTFESKRLSEELIFFDGLNGTWAQERLEAYREFLQSDDMADDADGSKQIILDVSADPFSLRYETESYLNFAIQNDCKLDDAFRLLIVFDTDCLEIEPVPTEVAVSLGIKLNSVDNSSRIFPPKGSLISCPFLLTEKTSIPFSLRLVRRATAKGFSTPCEIFLLASSTPTNSSSDSRLQGEENKSSRLVLRRCIPIELPHGEIQYRHLNQTLVTNAYVTTEILFPNQSHTLRESVSMQSTCESGLFADVFPIDSHPSSRSLAQWHSWLSTQKPLMKITANLDNPTDSDPNNANPSGSSKPDESSAMNPELRGFTGFLYALGYPNDDSRTLRFIDFDIARPQEYLTPTVSFDSNINRLRIEFVLQEKSNRAPLGPVSVQTRFIGLDPQSVTGKNTLAISKESVNRLQFEFSDPMPETLRLEIDVDGFPRAFVYLVDSRETRLDVMPISSQPNVEFGGLDDRLFLSMTQADKLLAKIDLKMSNQEAKGYGVSVVQESIENGFEPVGIAKITDDRQTVLDLTVLPTPGTVRIDSHVSDFQLSFPSDALYDRPTRLVTSIEKDGLIKPIRSVPLFIDTQPPTIESLELSPSTRIVSVDDTLELKIGVADKGSGVASVEMVAIDADIDEPPADAEWIPATFDAENIWKCSLGVGEKASKLQLFVRLTDAVGNALNSRLPSITVIAKGKSEIEKTLKLYGRVLHRGKPVDSGTVTLIAETKPGVKTKPKEIKANIKPTGSYLLEGIQKGKYTAKVKLVINNKVILTEQELDLSDPKSPSINQDLFTDKAPR